MPDQKIRPLHGGDRAWVSAYLERHWGSPSIVTRGTLHRADRLPGYVAIVKEERVGLVTYRMEGRECEVISLNSDVEGVGIGSALLEAVEREARRRNCGRLWLITTNDNLHAIGFYQRRGLVLRALYPNALEASRQVKPEIPLVGMNRIPLRDEVEMEMLLV